VKIGIIGAGMIGANLTRRLTALGHEVSVANTKSPETLTALAEETGATPVWATDAAIGSEIVVVAIPLSSVPNLPSGLLAGLAPGAAVVDTGNYYPPRDGRIEEIAKGMTDSGWVERHLGYPITKAFNGILADRLLTHARPAGAPDRIALPVAGDDAAAKAKVIDLLDQLGFDSFDAGGLDDSWRQQIGTPVFCTDLDLDQADQALADAIEGRSEEWWT
jgi:8-hydroxy-5-deazaflavin:NADPH oxidoreductase